MIQLLPSPPLSKRRYCGGRRHAVTLDVCVSELLISRIDYRISLGGEGNALYPVLSSSVYTGFWFSAVLQNVGNCLQPVAIDSSLLLHIRAGKRSLLEKVIPVHPRKQPGDFWNESNGHHTASHHNLPTCQVST